jgi:hypothetical protein
MDFMAEANRPKCFSEDDSLAIPFERLPSFAIFIFE